MLNKLFFFTAILILLTSCGTRRVTTTSKEVQTKIDTIVIEKNKTIVGYLINYSYICIGRVVATNNNIIQIPTMIKTTTF